MPDFNPQVTLYKNVGAFNPPIGHEGFISIINDIKNEVHGALIDSLQGLPEKIYKARKTGLPAATFSGTFQGVPNTDPDRKEGQDTSYRRAEGLLQYSQIIGHDIDELAADEMVTLRRHIDTNPFVLCSFISPSRNGLKIFFRTNTGAEQHLETWTALGHYLHTSYGIPWSDKKNKVKRGLDIGTKDICRLCFLSSDPNLYYNPDCDIVEPSFVAQHTPPPPAPKAAVQRKAAVVATAESTKTEAIIAQLIAGGIDITEPYDQWIKIGFALADEFAEGGRNYFHSISAISAKYDAAACDKQYDNCLSSRRGTVKIGSLYGTAKDVGVVYKTERTGSTSQRPPSVPPGDAPPADGAPDGAPDFWHVKYKQAPDGGYEESEYTVSYDKAPTFLAHYGFCKYRLRRDSDYQVIHVTDGGRAVDVVNNEYIKSFMYVHLRRLADEVAADGEPDKKLLTRLTMLREKFVRASKNLVSVVTLDLLPQKLPQLRRDTQDMATLYFDNCFVEITAEKIETKDYSQLQGGGIWKKQRNERCYSPADWRQSDFATFLCRAFTGEKVTPDTITPEHEGMMLAAYTAYGYLLHGYKSRSLVKMIIGADRVLRRGKENEGGSGKSLFIDSIALTIPVTNINGKRFDPVKDQFSLQKVQADTRVINLDDLKKGQDITELFSLLTADFDIEKKGKDVISASYEDSPKWYGSLNATLRGEGGSVSRRIHVIEFSGYYSKKHQPEDEFGHQFFSGWSAEEWDRFTSFQAHCLQMFLQHGLLPFPVEHYELNKIIDAAGEDFVDYMDDKVMAAVDGGTRNEWPYDELYEEWNKRFVELKKWKSNTFTARMKQWAEAVGLVYNPHKDGERDRRNNVVYCTFAKPGQLVAPPPDAAPGEDEKLHF